VAPPRWFWIPMIHGSTPNLSAGFSFSLNLDLDADENLN
jgi:hypothetical protein